MGSSRGRVARAVTGPWAVSVLLAGLVMAPEVSWGAPKPIATSGRYDLDILGFNDGDPYRLQGAAAEAVLRDPGAAVLRFESSNWMDEHQPTRWVPVRELAARYPGRSVGDLVAVYRVDSGGASGGSAVEEVLLVPDLAALRSAAHRFAPSLLRLGAEGYTPVWAAEGLRGERFRVVDLRDLGGDGRPEILLAGEAGRSGYYLFHELVGRTPDGFASLAVRHVDSVHYVDLDRDGRAEVVVRERVGRRGPAYQWTYVDQLHQWDGAAFSSAEREFPRYHDEQTLPTLVGNLLDHADAKLPILMEKVDAIRRVRERVLTLRPRPDGHAPRVVPALAALHKGREADARKRLEALDAVWPYDPQVLLGLAALEREVGRWEGVLDLAVRALTVEPTGREAWWLAAQAFLALEERSSALASLRHAMTLGGAAQEGRAFLEARRAEAEGNARLVRALDEALRAKGRDSPIRGPARAESER